MKERREAIFLHEPIRADGIYQAEFRAIFEAESTHEATNYLVHITWREKNTQLELGMTKDPIKQSSKVPMPISAREGRRSCLAQHDTNLRAEHACRFQFTQ